MEKHKNIILERHETYTVLGNYNQPGFTFKVSNEDLDRVMHYCWSKNQRGYVRGRAEGGRDTVLHHFILPLNDPELLTDHINRDKTDNRRENLRIVPARVNAINRDDIDSYFERNGYLGVFRTKKYFATRFFSKKQNKAIRHPFYDEKLCALYYDWLVYLEYKDTPSFDIQMQYTNIGLGLLKDYSLDILPTLTQEYFNKVTDRPYVSKYQGITFEKKSKVFVCRIHKTIDGKSVQVYRETFDTEIEAVKDRNRFYREHPEYLTSRTKLYPEIGE